MNISHNIGIYMSDNITNQFLSDSFKYSNESKKLNFNIPKELALDQKTTIRKLQKQIEELQKELLNNSNDDVLYTSVLNKK